MNEFEFIAKYLRPLAGPEGLDLLDDASVWSPPEGYDAVITTDTMVEGIHFRDGKFDADIAYKLLAVNLSDLTAKGAEPVGYFLNLAIAENTSSADLAEFCAGLQQFQETFEISVWGGDTTRAVQGNVLSVTMLGVVPKGKAVLRSGAKPGDILAVTGAIGDGVIGLKCAQKQRDMTFFEADETYFLEQLHRPRPPVEIRSALQEFASAALDVSDGLIADAGHIANASKVKLTIDQMKIPVSEPALRWLSAQQDQLAARIDLATGGDDYQVLMCVPCEHWDAFNKEFETVGIKISRIGIVEDGEGMVVQDADGKPLKIGKSGYKHF